MKKDATLGWASGRESLRQTGHIIQVYILSLVAQTVKILPANAEDTTDKGSIPGSGSSLGGGHGNPLQHSCMENPHGHRSLMGYRSWGHKELDTTEATEHTLSCLFK